ncbi:MAG: hypothetical protein JXB10_02590 [Pirellulales bacterium]|nr:hypothetical protein [Pirellulales bacterium]
MLKRMWREDEGVLTFEWIVLITLLVVGVVGGMAAVRDAINIELEGVAGAIIAVDQSYKVCSPIITSIGNDPGAECCASGSVGWTYTRGTPLLSKMRGDATEPVTPGACEQGPQ